MILNCPSDQKARIEHANGHDTVGIMLRHGFTMILLVQRGDLSIQLPDVPQMEAQPSFSSAHCKHLTKILN